MTQQTWSWSEPGTSRGCGEPGSFERRVENALLSGISKMVRRGRVSMDRIGEVFQRFGLDLSRRELLNICRRQGWSVRLERDPGGFSFAARYMIWAAR